MSKQRSKSLTALLEHGTGVERAEIGRALTAALMFFLTLGSYFAVRPVRETVGTLLGRDRTAALFVWTWALSLAIVPAYGCQGGHSEGRGGRAQEEARGRWRQRSRSSGGFGPAERAGARGRLER